MNLSIKELLNSLYATDENGVGCLNFTNYGAAPVGLTGRNLSQPLLSAEDIFNSIMGIDTNGLPALRINPPATTVAAFKLTWDDIGNALYTDIGDYNTLLGSDFTTLTVDGNDQLLTGNSTTFAMPTNAFNGNVNLLAIDDAAESCTLLGDGAFQDCASLTTVSLPACTTVGTQAFSGCTALTTVSLPACTSVGESAFYGCTSLTAATLAACTWVGTQAFRGCTALTTASFPACTTVGNDAFLGCTALTNVNIPLCEALGSTTGDDKVFFSITGNTITLTIAASRATCDGGNPDGDIVYLSANNTATINYI